MKVPKSGMKAKVTYCPPASAANAELQEYQFWFPTLGGSGVMTGDDFNRRWSNGVQPELAALTKVERLKAKQRRALRAPREATA